MTSPYGLTSVRASSGSQQSSSSLSTTTSTSSSSTITPTTPQAKSQSEAIDLFVQFCVGIVLDGKTEDVQKYYLGAKKNLLTCKYSDESFTSLPLIAKGVIMNYVSCKTSEKEHDRVKKEGTLSSTEFKKFKIKPFAFELAAATLACTIESNKGENQDILQNCFRVAINADLFKKEFDRLYIEGTINQSLKFTDEI